MDLNAAASYHLNRDGQQFGPYPGDQLVQMAQAQQVLATDQIWCEGMADWAAAQSFNQLAPFFTAQPQVSAAPGTDTQTVQTSVEQGGALRVARKGVSGPGLVKANIQTNTGAVSTQPGIAGRPVAGRTGGYQNVGNTGKKGASFAVLGWSLLGFFVGIGLILAGTVIAGTGAPTLDDLANPDFVPPPPNPAAVVMMMIGGLLYPVSLLIYGIFTLIYLYRAWSYIQLLPEVRSTPGKAIGFLFIPFFNIYWIFMAYWGWAVDYNLLKERAQLVRGPQVSSGLFLAFPIVSFLAGPLLHPFVMNQLCQAVNFLAATPDSDIVGQAV